MQFHLELSETESNAKERKETREYLSCVCSKINMKMENKYLETFISHSTAISYVNIIIKQEKFLYFFFILSLKLLTFIIFSKIFGT